jgi:hypothetical protein
VKCATAVKINFSELNVIAFNSGQCFMLDRSQLQVVSYKSNQLKPTMQRGEMRDLRAARRETPIETPRRIRRPMDRRAPGRMPSINLAYAHAP